MKEISLQSNNGMILASSKEVAEKFGKRHDKMLSEIKRMYFSLTDEGVTQNGGDPLFIKSTYVHEQNNQEYPIYLMNRDGFSLLVMGFTGAKALEWKLKYINAFNKMEEELKSGNYLSDEEKLKLQLFSKDPMEVASAHNKLVELATAPLIAENNELKPKAEFHDTVRSTSNSIPIGKFSGVVQKNPKLKKFGRNNMFKWLRNNGYLCTSEDLKNKPTQKALSGGYMEYEESVGETYYGNPVTTYKPLVTGKGQIYFIKKLLEDAE